MDFGLYLGAAVAGPTAGPDRIRTLTLAAETLGLHSVWVPDHIVIPMEVKSTYPYYVVRVIGGLLYLSGMLVMAWNVVMTISAGQSVRTRIPATAAAHA